VKIAGAAHEARGAEAGTRERVVASLLGDGPATAATLAERLELTPAAVRRHLDALRSEGLVESRERPPYGLAAERGRGRPARYFALTDAGRRSFPQAYDDLAAAALRQLAEIGGEGAVTEFARRRAAALVARHAAEVTSAADPAEALAAALTSEGFLASAQASAGGAQVCQHHCPVALVAAEFPQLCEAETEAFAELLGTHVQRLATIAHGDHVCTTHIPRNISSTLPRPERTPA
jgi:predicted ArsR family transcriptional regulator